MSPAPTIPAAKSHSAEIDPWLDMIAAANFEALHEPPVSAAVAALRFGGEPTALALADVLRRALASAEPDWLALHRPLYVLDGMGSAVRSAHPELVAALEVGPPANALLAARVIGQLGNGGRPAAPALRRAAERWGVAGRIPKSIANALAAIGDF